MAANPSIQLGTDGNWAIKEDNLLAYKKDGTRFFNKEFDFTRGSLATFVDKDGLIKYSGVTDTELVVNGDFSNWTNDNPDGWTITGTENENNYITEYQGKARYVSDGSTLFMSQNILTTGKFYKVTADIVVNSGGGMRFQLGANGTHHVFTTTQSIVLYAQQDGTDSNLQIIRQGATDFTIDNVSVKEIQTDVPRIDFTDDTTGHLLLEPQSTNLLPYSEDLSQWSNNNSVTLTSGQLAPDGTLGATKVSGIIGSSSIFNTSSSSETATRSIYAKTVSGTGTARLMSYFGNTNNLFTLTEQWQRFELTGSIVPGGTNFYVDFRDNTQTLNEFIIWGAQSEALPYATSYIPTSGSTATRNGEVCNNSGSAQDFNSEEGVLYAEIAALANSDTTNPNRGISISSGSTNNTIFIYYQSAANRLACILISNGTTQFSHSTTLFSVDDYLKIVLKYRQNDFALWVNGVEVATDTSGNAPSGLNRLAFDNGAGNDDFYGNVKNLKVFKRALSDGELYLLTVPQYQSYQEMATALNYTL